MFTKFFSQIFYFKYFTLLAKGIRTSNSCKKAGEPARFFNRFIGLLIGSHGAIFYDDGSISGPRKKAIISSAILFS